MKKKICTLVTGVGGRSVGHQILHALLLLGDKYKIVVTDAEPFSFGLYQVKQRYLVPKASQKGYLEAIGKIVEREKVDVILPGTQSELYKLTEGRRIFLRSGCQVLAAPFSVVKLCDHKGNLSIWLAKNGFAQPATSSDWRTLIKKVGFPLVGKPVQNTGGSRNVEILLDESEVKKYLSTSRKNGDEVFFQQYVGTEDTEYTVGVLTSKEGKLIDSIAMHRKLIGLSLLSKKSAKKRSYSLSSGYSQGFFVKNPMVQAVCEDLAVKIKACGPINVQCRVQNGKVFIFEVHPRFSGTTSSRADAGFNEPDIMIRNWRFNEKFGKLDYQTDVASIRAFQNVIVPLSSLQSITTLKR